MIIFAKILYFALFSSSILKGTVESCSDNSERGRGKRHYDGYVGDVINTETDNDPAEFKESSAEHFYEVVCNCKPRTYTSSNDGSDIIVDGTNKTNNGDGFTKEFDEISKFIINSAGDVSNRKASETKRYSKRISERNVPEAKASANSGLDGDVAFDTSIGGIGRNLAKMGNIFFGSASQSSGSVDSPNRLMAGGVGMVKDGIAKSFGIASGVMDKSPNEHFESALGIGGASGILGGDTLRNVFGFRTRNEDLDKNEVSLGEGSKRITGDLVDGANMERVGNSIGGLQHMFHGSENIAENSVDFHVHNKAIGDQTLVNSIGNVGVSGNFQHSVKGNVGVVGNTGDFKDAMDSVQVDAVRNIQKLVGIEGTYAGNIDNRLQKDTLSSFKENHEAFGESSKNSESVNAAVNAQSSKIDMSATSNFNTNVGHTRDNDINIIKGMNVDYNVGVKNVVSGTGSNKKTVENVGSVRKDETINAVHNKENIESAISKISKVVSSSVDKMKSAFDEQGIGSNSRSDEIFAEGINFRGVKGGIIKDFGAGVGKDAIQNFVANVKVDVNTKNGRNFIDSSAATAQQFRTMQESFTGNEINEKKIQNEDIKHIRGNFNNIDGVVQKGISGNKIFIGNQGLIKGNTEGGFGDVGNSIAKQVVVDNAYVGGSNNVQFGNSIRVNNGNLNRHVDKSSISLNGIAGGSEENSGRNTITSNNEHTHKVTNLIKGLDEHTHKVSNVIKGLNEQANKFTGVIKGLTMPVIETGRGVGAIAGERFEDSMVDLSRSIGGGTKIDFDATSGGAKIGFGTTGGTGGSIAGRIVENMGGIFSGNIGGGSKSNFDVISGSKGSIGGSLDKKTADGFKGSFEVGTGDNIKGLVRNGGVWRSQVGAQYNAPMQKTALPTGIFDSSIGGFAISGRIFKRSIDLETTIHNKMKSDVENNETLDSIDNNNFSNTSNNFITHSHLNGTVETSDKGIVSKIQEENLSEQYTFIENESIISNDDGTDSRLHANTHDIVIPSISVSNIQQVPIKNSSTKIPDVNNVKSNEISSDIDVITEINLSAHTNTKIIFDRKKNINQTPLENDLERYIDNKSVNNGNNLDNSINNEFRFRANGTIIFNDTEINKLIPLENIIVNITNVNSDKIDNTFISDLFDMKLQDHAYTEVPMISSQTIQVNDELISFGNTFKAITYVENDKNEGPFSENHINSSLQANAHTNSTLIIGEKGIDNQKPQTDAVDKTSFEDTFESNEPSNDIDDVNEFNIKVRINGKKIFISTNKPLESKLKQHTDVKRNKTLSINDITNDLHLRAQTNTIMSIDKGSVKQIPLENNLKAIKTIENIKKNNERVLEKSDIEKYINSAIENIKEIIVHGDIIANTKNVPSGRNIIDIKNATLVLIGKSKDSENIDDSGKNIDLKKFISTTIGRIAMNKLYEKIILEKIDIKQALSFKGTIPFMNRYLTDDLWTIIDDVKNSLDLGSATIDNAAYDNIVLLNEPSKIGVDQGNAINQSKQTLNIELKQNGANNGTRYLENIAVEQVNAINQRKKTSNIELEKESTNNETLHLENIAVERGNAINERKKTSNTDFKQSNGIYQLHEDIDVELDNTVNKIQYSEKDEVEKSSPFREKQFSENIGVEQDMVFDEKQNSADIAIEQDIVRSRIGQNIYTTEKQNLENISAEQDDAINVNRTNIGGKKYIGGKKGPNNNEKKYKQELSNLGILGTKYGSTEMIVRMHRNRKRDTEEVNYKFEIAPENNDSNISTFLQDDYETITNQIVLQNELVYSNASSDSAADKVKILHPPERMTSGTNYGYTSVMPQEELLNPNESSYSTTDSANRNISSENGDTSISPENIATDTNNTFSTIKINQMMEQEENSKLNTILTKDISDHRISNTNASTSAVFSTENKTSDTSKSLGDIFPESIDTILEEELNSKPSIDSTTFNSDDRILNTNDGISENKTSDNDETLRNNFAENQYLSMPLNMSLSNDILSRHSITVNGKNRMSNTSDDTSDVMLPEIKTSDNDETLKNNFSESHHQSMTQDELLNDILSRYSTTVNGNNIISNTNEGTSDVMLPEIKTSDNDETLRNNFAESRHRSMPQDELLNYILCRISNTNEGMPDVMSAGIKTSDVDPTFRNNFDKSLTRMMPQNNLLNFLLKINSPPANDSNRISNRSGNEIKSIKQNHILDFLKIPNLDTMDVIIETFPAAKFMKELLSQSEKASSIFNLFSNNNTKLDLSGLKVLGLNLKRSLHSNDVGSGSKDMNANDRHMRADDEDLEKWD